MCVQSSVITNDVAGNTLAYYYLYCYLKILDLTGAYSGERLLEVTCGPPPDSRFCAWHGAEDTRDVSWSQSLRVPCDTWDKAGETAVWPV